MRYRFAFALLLSATTLQPGVSAQEATPEIHEYVRRMSIDRHVNGSGESYREMRALYDSSIVPALVEMLNSEAEKAYWARIAGMLGVVGDERATESLIAFVEEPATEVNLSQEHHDARGAAIAALGYLVNSTGSERALTYLIDGLTPSNWRQRNVLGLAPWLTSYEEYDLLLSEYALYGLALSGHPRAGEALKSLRQASTPEPARFLAGREGTLEQWLEVHQLVAERGVAGMYDYYNTKEKQRIAQEVEEAQRRREEMEERERLREAQQPR